MNETLRVLYLSAEMQPYAATGGLAQVAAALPRAIQQLGDDIRVILPRYGGIDPQKLGLKRIVERFPVPFESETEWAGLWQAPDAEIPTYFIEHERFFGSRQGIYAFPDDAERFIFYSRASLEAMRFLDWQPDVIHCNEWQTALIPNWLKTLYQDDPFFARTAVVYTIHNLGYQGIFGYRVLEIAGIAQQGFIAHPDISPSLNQVVSMMGRGIIFADIITTVSPSYAREIQTPEFGEGLDPILRDRSERLIGILNGLDTIAWDPGTDSALSAQFSSEDMTGKATCKSALQQAMGLEVDADAMLIGLTSRLIDAKGFDILTAVIEPMLRLLPIQMVVLGAGEARYHHALTDLQQRYPQRLAFHAGYDESIARRVYAGSDAFLMPSRFEPGGLDQLKAMRYGAIPIVHATGGLKDTVIDHHPPETGTGFRFEPYDCMALYAGVVRAVEIYHHSAIWQAIQQNAMTADHSVMAAARAYRQVYRLARSYKLTGAPPAETP